MSKASGTAASRYVDRREEDVPPDVVDALVAKWGPGLVALRTKSGPVVIKTPTRTQFKQFRQMMMSDRTKVDAAEWLCQACTVYPDPQEQQGALLQMFEANPGIALKISLAAQRLAGTEDSEELEEKKLGT